MIAYLDTSVILRRLFGQPRSIANWGTWEVAYTSEITRIEALRTIDRERLSKHLRDAEVASCVLGLEDILDRLGEMNLSRVVLRRAAQSFSTSVSTLDALHLASALLWQEKFQKELIFLTHDVQLGVAAQAMGMKTEGFQDNSIPA